MSSSEVVERVIQRMAWQEDRQMMTILEAITNGTVRGIRESLKVTVEEANAPAVQAFVTETSERLIDVSTSWTNEQSKKLIVFPVGTRYVQRDDKSTNIVIEEAPRCRRVAFNDRSGVVKHYYVSLPYIQYVITFTKHGRGEKFRQMKISCSKQPIDSLTSIVYDLPLPNMGYGNRFGVCTGSGSSGMELPEGSDAFTEKCETLITSFWSSEFNTDLSSNFVSFFQKNFGHDTLEGQNSIQRLHACFSNWAEVSKQNPMWSLGADVKFPQDAGAQLGRLIDSDLTSRGSKAAMTRNLKQQVTEGLFALSANAVECTRTISFEEQDQLNANKQKLKECYRSNLHSAYSILESEATGAFEQLKLKELEKIQEDRRKVDEMVRKIAEDRQKFDSEMLKTKIELSAVHKFLEAEKVKVALIQAQAEEIIARGVVAVEPVVKRGRGRPRKEKPPVPLGPDGQPIKRGRGRPRKTPVVLPARHASLMRS